MSYGETTSFAGLQFGHDSKYTSDVFVTFPTARELYVAGVYHYSMFSKWCLSVVSCKFVYSVFYSLSRGLVFLYGVAGGRQRRG